MKLFLRVVLSLVGVVLLVALIAFAVGATLPVDHTVSISGTVNAPPEKVFARIVDVAEGPSWRPQVKGVEILPRDNGRDAWVEDLGSGVKMKFLALTTTPVGANGKAMRKVDLKDPSYGGSWTYLVSPGPGAGTTTLKITEDGFINPPIYRFMMKYIFGPTKNLDDYMRAMQAANKG